ncbi:maltose acetyltransferase [Candidatus Termititenax aidoneus]|uniref:Acetyltransferase n=1 Tax=Termititenax aidoneus TaxID=2218524 RepID=A0A388TD15_TERA1|nr:maltose acetyltransferase [Candidatus Termititenax aidoneus]
MTGFTDKQKRLAGKLYIAQGQEFLKDILRCRKLLRKFNQSSPHKIQYRTKLLKTLFQQIGAASYIEPPFHCDYGAQISIGDNFYANVNCVILDVCAVTIDQNVFLGPNVGIYTAAHPLDAAVRAERLEYGRPVTIGDNVWLGGGVSVLPGVAISDNVVVGAGSVVTKNIPANVVAAGNPCKILRRLTVRDKKFWEKQRQEYYRLA